MKIKVTLWNHMRLFRWLLFLLLLFLFMGYFITGLDDGFWFSFCLMFIVLQLIPQLIFHLKYTVSSYNLKITISISQIIIENKSGTRIFLKKDIQAIKIVKPAVLDKGGWQMGGFQSYYFAKITFINKENIIITNLMHPNLEEVFDEFGYSYYREKGFGWWST